METHVYQLPTKLYHVEDTLLSFGPIQLTLRQCVVLVLGGCGSLDIWQNLHGIIPAIIALGVAGIPLLIAVVVAGGRVADRYAEAWLLVLLEYLQCERVYLWRPTQPKTNKERNHA